MYSEKLLNYFHNTKHQGRLDAGLPGVVSARVGTRDNEDVLQLFLQIENNVIIQARFLAIGSVAIIGGGEWLCEFLLNKTGDDIRSLSSETILQSLDLPKVKIHVVQLLHAAVTECMDAV